MSGTLKLQIHVLLDHELRAAADAVNGLYAMPREEVEKLPIEEWSQRINTAMRLCRQVFAKLTPDIDAITCINLRNFPVNKKEGTDATDKP
ncbi:MAG: hypothetical protein IMZ62_12905 [Chloroflexi bacterium]|nr:hypothetical protein [Chloroflexota bacterium]MBE3119103.1 hypothetical protein [Candidatus Atribacteria bacterium]